jgi:hypothetical protein
MTSRFTLVFGNIFNGRVFNRLIGKQVSLR